MKIEIVIASIVHNNRISARELLFRFLYLASQNIQLFILVLVTLDCFVQIRHLVWVFSTGNIYVSQGGLNHQYDITIPSVYARFSVPSFLV